ncbi:OB-fold protein [Xenorhabdus innexi]|uniref:tRNA_anti-like n=1 Tax=Xenorhabdus innexi TaxID=290109 RepID=A0A1N6MWG2_9GAMM|nr:hypothetical protein [Xenorhabdus innexi]PHM36604.1 hypothetical protein Xinn_01547 [Xenorhabdus innexi]SIP73151.1 exported hypothetical protein [Xenorhabdus innexi]
MIKKLTVLIFAMGSLFFLKSAVANGNVIPFTENDAKFAKYLVDNDVKLLFHGEKKSGDYGYIYITSKDLYRRYAENEVRANKDLKYKKVIISGLIKSINNYSSDGKVFIALSAGSFLDTVHAALSNDFQDYALTLRKGQKIILACEVAGTAVGEPFLKNCISENKAKGQVAGSIISQINRVLSGDKSKSNKVGINIVALTKLVDLSTNNFSICKKIDISCLNKSKSSEWKKFVEKNREKIERYKEMLE